jgi:glycine cleavage system regulatory protein
MVLSVDVPVSADTQALVTAVAQLASELDVDASLRPADDDLL